jgi:hypothetical protein
MFESPKAPAEQAFDVALLAAILVSVAVVILDSVESIVLRHWRLLPST